MTRRAAKKLPAVAEVDLDHDLRSLVGYCISRAFHRVRVQVRKVLEPMGLRRVTMSALGIIRATPGLNQANLADALVVERPNVVAIVDEMEHAGWVVRERSQTDRRAYELKITAAGEALWQKAIVEVRCVEDGLVRGLSAEERRRLIRALRHVEDSE